MPHARDAVVVEWPAINTLKLDKSFIASFPHNTEAVKLAYGIIRIAHDLHLNVAAEGVEHEE